MNKLIELTTLAALAAIVCGCATKSRTFDAKGMYVSESGQLAIGYVHVDAIPEGTDSAVIHYEEDVALLSPSTKTHDIDIILTGTNSVGSAEGIVSAICKAFVEIVPNAKGEAKCATSPIDLAKSNREASAKKCETCEEQASETRKECCADGSCSD